MPFVFIPYADDHERAGAVRETYYPTGSDIAAVCERCGWYVSPPPGVAIYNRDGNLDPTTAEFAKTKPAAPVENDEAPPPTRRTTKGARSHG